MDRTMSEGQRAYERKRAARAGMSLEKWLDAREREKRVAEAEAGKPHRPARKPKAPGLLSRLIQRAHKPL